MFRCRPHSTTAQHLPFERVVLVLQVAARLARYQAGVYEALAERRDSSRLARRHVDWRDHAAIIAGNPPNLRVERLRDFWTQVTDDALWPWFNEELFRGEIVRSFLNLASANLALASGSRGFFTAHPGMPWLQPAGTIEATSFYDTRHLKRTLQRLVDFDRLNAADTRPQRRCSHVRTGNMVYFDPSTHKIGPEHVMASGALPPGFPAIEIEGEHYWDGASFPTPHCNGWPIADRAATPWCSRSTSGTRRGQFPRNMLEVITREKEIRYSSRTRVSTDQFKHIQKLRCALASLLEKLPEDLGNSGGKAPHRCCGPQGLQHRGI